MILAMAVSVSSTSVISPKLLGKLVSRLCCYAEPEMSFDFTSFYRGGKLRPTLLFSALVPKEDSEDIAYDFRVQVESMGLLADVRTFHVTDNPTMDKVRVKICLP